MKLVAIINDSTGKTYAVLRGYEDKLVASPSVLADSITLIKDFSKSKTSEKYSVKFDGFVHYLSDKHYSAIWDLTKDE